MKKEETNNKTIDKQKETINQNNETIKTNNEPSKIQELKRKANNRIR